MLETHLEIIDFGYPQNSEIDTLKTYITTESIVSSAIAAEESSKITSQATGTTSWRRADVKYKKNEAFVDVVETVNLSMSAKGAPVLYCLFIRLLIIGQETYCELM